MMFITLFLQLAVIISCSTEKSDNNKEQTENSFVYKSASYFADSTLFQTQELFYNDKMNLERIVTNMGNGGLITIIEVIYNDNDIVSKVIKSTSSRFPNQPETYEEYNVKLNKNSILLSKSNGDDYGILIEFTGEYVDLIKSDEHSNMNPLSDKIYKRNSDNNILSYADHTYKTTFSNHVKGDIMPLTNPDLTGDYFIVFNLKTSNKYPLTHTKAYLNGEVLYTDTFDASLITYDENDNIIKIGNDSDYVAYKYIEL